MKRNVITKSNGSNSDTSSVCGGGTTTTTTTTTTTSNDSKRNNNNSNNIHLRQNPIPKYKKTTRKQCMLLTFIWERNWPSTIKRLDTHPSEIFCITTDWGRTALHLAMLNQGCPIYVANALLKANKHAVIIQDYSGFTPLHYACMFVASSSSSSNNNNSGGGGGTTDLIPILCNAVIHVENTYVDCYNPITNNDYKEEPQSPLYLACKRNASIQTIHTLLLHHQRNYNGHHQHHHQEEQEQQTTKAKAVEGLSWIAPSTGAEPYYYYNNEHHHHHHNGRCDEDDAADSNIINYDTSSILLLPSPLAELWKQRTSDIPHLNNKIKRTMKQIASEIIIQQSKVNNNDNDEEAVVAADIHNKNKGEKEEENEDHDDGSESDDDEDDEDDDDVNNFMDLWRKSITLIVEEYYRQRRRRRHHHGNNNNNNKRIKLLHAVIVLRIPIPMLLQAVAQVYPEQAMEKDCNNLIPLHHIFRLVELRITNKPITIHVMFACILQANTNAASIRMISDYNSKDNKENNNTPKKKCFPLIKAIELQMNYSLIIKTLVQAYPKVLKVRDVTTHLYPFLLAAATMYCNDTNDTSSSSSSSSSIDTIFYLLISCPEVIGYHIQ